MILTHSLPPFLIVLPTPPFFFFQGLLKEAMINYLAALGWNDGTDKEIYQVSEIVEMVVSAWRELSHKT